jgi:hypothetical protein
MYVCKIKSVINAYIHIHTTHALSPKGVAGASQIFLLASTFFPTLISLSGVGTCFHHVVVKIRQLFLRLATCLMSTLLETGVQTTGNASTYQNDLAMRNDAEPTGGKKIAI